MTTIAVEYEIRRILAEAGGGMQRHVLIRSAAETCGLNVKTVRAVCAAMEKASKLGRMRSERQDRVTLDGVLWENDHYAAMLAIVRDHGPIERQKLISLVMAQTGRAEQSCYGALRNLVAIGQLEREEHSRKCAIIREPATQTLLAILGGARLPAIIPNGRIISGLCGGAGEVEVESGV